MMPVLAALAVVTACRLGAQGASQHSVRWDDVLPEPSVNQNKQPTFLNAMRSVMAT